MIFTSQRIKLMSGSLCLFLISLLAVYPTSSQESSQELIWVTVEGTSPLTSDNQEQARVNAINVAERNAVAAALAPKVSVETLVVNLRLAGSIIGTIPYGKVVSREIVAEGPVESTEADSSVAELRYRVRLNAGVAQESGRVDPSFYLDASINQSIFKDGDELEIQIRSTRNCYLAIFNILEDRKVTRLLPNYLIPESLLKADENYTFPGKEDRQKGLRLRLHLPENREMVTECIYLLALPHPFEPTSMGVQEGIFGVFNGQTAFMKDLIGEVVSIPLKSRAEALIQYEIRRTQK
jgi:hypothetical protein